MKDYLIESMTVYTVTFDNGKKVKLFSIITNVEMISPSTVSAMVESWADTKHEFTAYSLCEHIKSMNSEFVAYPIKNVNPKQ
jgi:hypothetical protein